MSSLKEMAVQVCPGSITLFSQRKFSEAAAAGLGGVNRVFGVQVGEFSAGNEMCGVGKFSRFVIRDLHFSPFGLYASPGWLDAEVTDRITGVLRTLTRSRIKRFTWTVRFDHRSLGQELSQYGLKEEIHQTHVLDLNRPFEELFQQYSSSLKNHIRRSEREGVVVRSGNSLEDLSRYYEVHLKLTNEMGGYKNVYSLDLLQRLVRLSPECEFLVAEWQGIIIGGAIFFVDGESFRYWHGAFDRGYSKQYASCAVLNTAIRIACVKGLSSFNFGGSAGIKSLEHFKEMWGATSRSYWMYEWKSRIWSAFDKWVFGAKQLLRK